MPAEIRAFFEHYREAFDRLDGEAVARLYAIPSGIASDGGYTHWPTFEPIHANMVALCALYRENGYVAATFEPVSFLAQGDNYAIADISWFIERSGQCEPWRSIPRTTWCAPRKAGEFSCAPPIARKGSMRRLSPNPAVNTDARRRGFAQAEVAGYLTRWASCAARS